jgi:predicted nucleic acid-binding protein
MYLLDTNILSELIRKQPDPGVLARAELLDQRDSFASEVTLFELRFGAMLRADSASFWQRLESELLPAVTRNESHFHRIPGLRVENWFST